MNNKNLMDKKKFVAEIIKLGFVWDDKIEQYGLIKGVNYYRIYFSNLPLVSMNSKISAILYHSKFDEGGNLKREDTVMGMSNISTFLNNELKYDIRKNKINKLLNEQND